MLGSTIKKDPNGPSGRLRGEAWKKIQETETTEDRLLPRVTEMATKEIDLYREMRQESLQLGTFLAQQIRSDKYVEKMNRSISHPALRRSKDFGEHPVIADRLKNVQSCEAELAALQLAKDRMQDRQSLFSKVARLKRSGMTQPRSVADFDAWREAYCGGSKRIFTGGDQNKAWREFACDRTKVVRWTSRDPLSLRHA
ncbi:unnamed protein product [Amoebophrya sp. A25]|nr:unnamed protein product [Amoebophrya sp. A25]|eukprot:GSA25T00019001001.1